MAELLEGPTIDQVDVVAVDHVYVINNAHIVESLDAQTVRAQPAILHRHLGV